MIMNIDYYILQNAIFELIPYVSYVLSYNKNETYVDNLMKL